MFQSLVLISKLPYVTFFHSLLKLVAPEYFERQEPCLEAGEYSTFEGASLALTGLSAFLDAVKPSLRSVFCSAKGATAPSGREKQYDILASSQTGIQI